MAAITALAIGALAWPLPLGPRSRVLGPSQNDFYSIAWGMDHVARTLADLGWPSLTTTRLAYPEGASLLVADLPEMVLVAPVTLLFGPTAAFNLLQVGHHALAAGAAFWCARVLGLGIGPALLPAAAFAFCPALVSCTFNQNPDVTAWYWVPLAAGLAHGARTLGRALLAGLAVALGFWCNAYGGIMAALCLALLLPLRPLHRYAAGLLVPALAGGAFVAVTWWTLHTDHPALHKGMRTDPFHGVATLPDLVSPPFRTMMQQFWDQSWFCHGSYLGWSLLVLGLVGLVAGRRWRWLALATVGLFFALGPHFILDRDTLWRSPYLLLERLPGLDRLHLNHRFTALVCLGLGMGAASLAQRWRHAYLVLLPVLLLDLLVATGGWRLLASQRPYDDGACALLADLEPGPVVDFPPTHAELWLFASTCHGRPVAEGINNPLPKSVRKVTYRGHADALPALRGFGFRYFVFHGRAPRAEMKEFQDLARHGAPCVVARNDQGVLVVDLACASGETDEAQLPVQE